MSNENREAVALDIILHEAERAARAECGGACGSPNCASINARRDAALARSEVERLRRAERERDAARAGVERLRAWKAAAMEDVMDGLQSLGKALGVGYGKRITGPEAVDIALNLRNERDQARAELADLREAMQDHDDLHDIGFEAMKELLNEARRALADADARLAAVRELADQHADWCCSKGCTGVGKCLSQITRWNSATGRCDESCNCESAPYRAALDTPTPDQEYS